MESKGIIDESIMKLSEEYAGQSGEILDKAFQGEEIKTKYMTRFEKLKDIRRPMEKKWEQVRDNLDPAATRWLGSGESGDDAIIDDSKIMDTVPRKMAQTAADGLHGSLSNPAMPWFSYYVGRYDSFDESISKEGKEWLQLAQECVRDVLAKTNYYLALHSLYREVLEFGCALMFGYSDADKYIRFYNYTIGSFWVAQNSRRLIDTAYIKHRSSAADIVNVYGQDRCPRVVIEAIENKNPDEKFTIIQCVQPWNFFGDIGEHPEFIFEDVRFVEEGEDTDPVIYRSGYRTKPFIFARWSESWDFVYPRSCPGIDALPDIRQLYKATEMYNMAVAWTSDPAFFYDSALEHDIKSVKPGHMIGVSGSGAKMPLQVIIPPVFDFGANITFRAALLDKISAIFYNREIMLITSRAEQNHVMTATEVDLLEQEKNAVLGPVTTRTSHDILIPSLDRTFEVIQNEWDILDKAPSDVSGQDITPYFTSDMAVTQRQSWIRRSNDVLMWWQGVVGANPEITDVFDWDRWAREFERTDVIPSFLIRDKNTVEKIRKGRMEMQQKSAQLEELGKIGKAGKDLGQTPTTGDNAASEMMGELTGGA